jgi:hypothetical protein
LRLLIKIVRPQNDRAISEFYPVQVFHGGDILMNILKIYCFEKMKRTKNEERPGGRLLYELSERKPG